MDLNLQVWQWAYTLLCHTLFCFQRLNHHSNYLTTTPYEIQYNKKYTHNGTQTFTLKTYTWHAVFLYYAYYKTFQGYYEAHRNYYGLLYLSTIYVCLSCLLKSPPHSCSYYVIVNG